jgi:hypothetical protein
LRSKLSTAFEFPDLADALDYFGRGWGSAQIMIRSCVSAGDCAQPMNSEQSAL